MSAVDIELDRNPHTAFRIWAMVTRYWYIFAGSWPRMIELLYWPMVQMVLWGFISIFLAEESSYFAQAFGILLGAVMLWDVLFRGQMGVSISFMEELWSRNMGHLMVSPLSALEHVGALLTLSVLKTFVAMMSTALMAWLLFGYSIFELGFPLIAFFFNLIMVGWAVGLAVSGIILRFGLSAEPIAWGFTFMLVPFSGVYYPTTVLPEFMQPISAGLPTTYVFDGMRAIMLDGVFKPELLAWAFSLNLFYLAIGIVIYLAFFRSAKVRGMLLQLGE